MFKLRPWATPTFGWPSFIFSMVFGILFSSCENPEGLGGTGSISGTITEYSYNDDYSSLIYQGASVDEEVFILFGEDQELGNRVRTGITGEFRFKYLYPGSYYIYYRSQDSTEIPDDGWSNVVKVDLDNGEDADLGELVKLNTVDYDDGAAMIKGVVKKIKYVDESRWPNLVIEYEDFAHEHEVYLTYGDHAFYDERARTQQDGYFEFSNLIPGKYLIVLYSEDRTRVVEHEVLQYEVTISELDQVVDLGEITVHEL